jgi:hypothetical protein
MKTCQYCGASNEDGAEQCVECKTDFPAPGDSVLEDPQSDLVILAKCLDLIEATRIRDELGMAGIEACIPEELAPNLFGNAIPLTPITVRVAARDYDRAKQVMDDLFPGEGTPS